MIPYALKRAGLEHADVLNAFFDGYNAARARMLEELIKAVRARAQKAQEDALAAALAPASAPQEPSPTASTNGGTIHVPQEAATTDAPPGAEQLVRKPSPPRKVRPPTAKAPKDEGLTAADIAAGASAPAATDTIENTQPTGDGTT